jgi:electron-transferring-flavoprotein dehydrogenase
MSTERETLEIDVLFVGAGPASLAGAYHLARRLQDHNKTATQKLEVSIAVLEKGKEIGAHALSGGILDPRSLKELFPEDWAAAPLEAPVGSERFLFLTESGSFRLPAPGPFSHHGCSVVSLGRLVKWMAGKVESMGVDVFCEFPAVETVLEGDRVVGVLTGDKGVGKDGHRKANFEPGIEIRSKAVVLGEGPRGTLTKQLDARFGLSQESNPQVYAIGLKEVWDLPPGRLAPGAVIHTANWPLGTKTFGGGFLYGMSGDQAIVGLVVGLDYENALLDPHLEFQRLKTHPTIRKILEGGRMSLYGAKAIPEGGYWAMPRLSGDGFLLIGDSGGFLNSQRLKGIHLAIKSGMLAADTIFAALVQNQGGAPSASQLATYRGRFESSWAHDELRKVRNFHQAFDHGLFAGMFQAGLGLVTGGRGWGFRDRLRNRPGHERLRSVSEATPSRPLAFDGKLTIDRLADVYNSATAHEEDQPVHLLVADTEICVTRCASEFGSPCQRFCPAAVYEIVTDATAKHGKRLQINASNCVHCKTCDVMDPYQIITWVPPEGGGGPNYSRM